MNPIIKEKWTAALRSGEYKQGQERLRTEDGFCCLGVLCDVHSKEMKKSWVSFKVGGMRGGDEPTCYRYLNCSGVLPSEVAEWAGLDRVSPSVSFEGRGEELTTLNDDGKTFEQIADSIEKSL